MAHHGSLGSFATVYVTADVHRTTIADRLIGLDGIEAVFDAAVGCARFELPADRVGDLLVFADRHHVIGTRAEDHDLSGLRGPLRSHGGLAERTVPLLCPTIKSRTTVRERPNTIWRRHNPRLRLIAFGRRSSC